MVQVALFTILASLILCACAGLFASGAQQKPRLPDGAAMGSATLSPSPQPAVSLQAPPASATPTPTIASTPIPRPTTLTETLTYTDTVIGYAIEYPTDWHVVSRLGGPASLTSFDPRALGPHEGLSAALTRIDLAPDEKEQTKTLDEMVAGAKGGYGSTPLQVLREEQWELSGGTPAIRLDLQSDSLPKTAVLLTVINGRSVHLVGYGDLSLFDAIARTLRPVPVPAVIITIGDDAGQ